MVLTKETIVSAGILAPCAAAHLDALGNSAGLGTFSYDLRVDQEILLSPGTFRLASTMERFSMPDDVVGIVHDKSSWARRGLAVQNTVIDPGWQGYLTLELTNHGTEVLRILRECGVCQVIFHRLERPVPPYSGKYQNQPRGPQGAR